MIKQADTSQVDEYGLIYGKEDYIGGFRRGADDRVVAFCPADTPQNRTYYEQLIATEYAVNKEEAVLCVERWFAACKKYDESPLGECDPPRVRDYLRSTND